MFPTDNAYFNLVWSGVRIQEELMAARRVTVHVAGPFVDGLQQCERCGRVLTDLRYEQLPDRAKAWPLGAHVEISSSYATTTDDPPTCHPQS